MTDLPPPPHVTVAVATFQRPKGVQTLLRALEAQTLGVEMFEVVIVDDHSGDDTPALLAEIAATSPLRLRTIRLDRNSGPAVARNTAWRAGSAPIVAFTDDDCAPTPPWLTEGLRAIQAAPSVLVGATQPMPEELHLIDPLSRTMRVERATFAPTCNVFYLREDLEAVNGFDETFRMPVGEDTDLAWRIVESRGRQLVFSAEAKVFHDVRQRTFKQAVKETYRWAGIPPVVARHKQMARKAWYKGYWLRISHPRVLMATAGLALAFLFPPFALLAAPWARQRVFPGRPKRTWIKNVRFAPAVFAIDLLEVWVLARASLKHRALIL
jgi:glycosyltransferase involved in cell wall biosynthesis